MFLAFVDRGLKFAKVAYQANKLRKIESIGGNKAARSGLGFGGAALTLPLLLLIYDQPLFWLPMVGTHLLFFTVSTMYSRLGNVDWKILKQNIVFILPTRMIGLGSLIS